VDVGLTLNVEPTIYLNNEIGIRISLEASTLVDTVTTKSGTTAYRIGTRSAATMLQLKDGENQVLAGLIKNDDRSSATHLPGLGDLPIVGRLFGSRQDTRDKTEVVLSITPHLVRNIQRPAANVAEFSAGTEASFRRRPDGAARAPAQLPAPAGAAGAPARAQPGAPVSAGAPASAAAPAAPAAAAALPAPQGAMVPATSVSAGGPPPSAPPSVPATSLPPTPGVQVVPVPKPDVTPLPARQ
jgi:general secretion pathway protein D